MLDSGLYQNTLTIATGNYTGYTLVSHRSETVYNETIIFNNRTFKEESFLEYSRYAIGLKYIGPCSSIEEFFEKYIEELI